MTRLSVSDFVSEEPLKRLEKQEEFVQAEGFTGQQRNDIFNPSPESLHKLTYNTLKDRGYGIFSFKVASYRHKSYEIWPWNKAFADDDGAYRRDTQPEDTVLMESMDPDDSLRRLVYLYKLEGDARRLLTYPVDMYLGNPPS